MESVQISLADIQKKAENELQRLANAGNSRETASFVQSIAEQLNVDDSQSSNGKKDKKDNEEKKKVNLTPAPLP